MYTSSNLAGTLVRIHPSGPVRCEFHRGDSFPSTRQARVNIFLDRGLLCPARSQAPGACWRGKDAMATKKAQNVENESERERRLHEVIGQFRAAEERGEKPNRQEFLDCHPDLADVLQEFFAEQDRFHDATRPIRDPADPHWSLPPPDTALFWLDDAREVDDSPSSGATTLPRGSATPPPAGTKVRSFADYELIAELGRG